MCCRLACDQHRRLKDLLVYALHCEELELAKEQKEKKKLHLAQLEMIQTYVHSPTPFLASTNIEQFNLL